MLFKSTLFNWFEREGRASLEKAREVFDETLEK